MLPPGGALASRPPVPGISPSSPPAPRPGSRRSLYGSGGGSATGRGDSGRCQTVALLVPRRPAIAAGHPGGPRPAATRTGYRGRSTRGDDGAATGWVGVLLARIIHE